MWPGRGAKPPRSGPTLFPLPGSWAQISAATGSQAMPGDAQGRLCERGMDSPGPVPPPASEATFFPGWRLVFQQSDAVTLSG